MTAAATISNGSASSCRETAPVAVVPSDREWLVPVAAIVSVEAALWLVAYVAGTAAPPMIATYGSIALAVFTVALCWNAARILLRERPPQPSQRLIAAAVENKERLISTALGSQILAFGSAAFAALKAGIPKLIPFWLDIYLARLEPMLFGSQAWQVLYSKLGTWMWFFDGFYGTFVGVHVLAVLVLLVAKSSFWKSRALVALALAWLLIGVVTAYCCSSAGPIFFDRVYGGHSFAALDHMLSREAPLTTFTGDALWAMHQSHVPAFANGISAMPSMHVALSLWLALVAHRTNFALFAWVYYALIWIGSVLLGWHWFLGGLVGSAAMLAVWAVAPLLIYRPVTARLPVPAAAA